MGGESFKKHQKTAPVRLECSLPANDHFIKSLIIINIKSLHVLLLHNEWQKAHEVYLNIAVCMTGLSWHWQVVNYTSLNKQVCFTARAVTPKRSSQGGLEA